MPSLTQNKNTHHQQQEEGGGNAQLLVLPDPVEKAMLMTYRAVGLGLYGAAMRYIGMPLEKIALFMNSTQVSGNNQLRQAFHLTFRAHPEQGVSSPLSPFTPYKVVGPASGVAWFLQYSVMGMVFQLCDTALSNALGVAPMPYGAQLMEDPSQDYNTNTNNTQTRTTNTTNDGEGDGHGHDDDITTTIKACTKLILAPVLAGTVESIVANRAEVQRYYGLQKFAQIESALKWNRLSKLCGPAFLANSSRNCIMSATSFVVTPILYRQYFPQENKSQSSLFWAGLGINIFIGNTIAITQQALWGRALDYAASPPPSSAAAATGANAAARSINYSSVIREGLAKDGISAFYTLPKWSTRVLMNAPVQGTLPWFYNDVLPLGEGQVMGLVRHAYSSFVSSRDGQRSVNGGQGNNTVVTSGRGSTNATNSGRVMCAEESSYKQ